MVAVSYINRPASVASLLQVRAPRPPAGLYELLFDLRVQVLRSDEAWSESGTECHIEICDFDGGALQQGRRRAVLDTVEAFLRLE